VNEQARKPEREAVLWTLWKHREIGRNDLFARKSGNRFDNNDPCININVHVKLSLIDLEAYSESQGDKGQATEMCAA
jgi:hypothetical protein